MKNLYKRWLGLNGRSVRTVGTCIAADFGECTIQYPGGGHATAKGSGQIGTRYFVLDGKLDGEAPSLTSLTIEI